MSNKIRTFSDLPKYEVSLSFPDGISKCILTKEEIEYLNSGKCEACGHSTALHCSHWWSACMVPNCPCEDDKMLSNEITEEPFCGAV